MKIEAVTISVDYADLLAEIAPLNKALLDKWVIVTHPSDMATRNVCHRYSLDCILTEEFNRDGDFSKARAINKGLGQLTGDGWILHMDSDICLPYDLITCLEDAYLEKGNIYGCSRLCVPGWDAWHKLKQQGLYSRFNGWLAEYRDRPQGCYVGGVPAGLGVGYAPIGFFQLWWGAESLSWGPTRKLYPVVHGGAARTDVAFANLWDRRNRIAIPELIVFHLEDDNAKHAMGNNWKGRKAPFFGPEKGKPYYSYKDKDKPKVDAKENIKVDPKGGNQSNETKSNADPKIAVSGGK